jgi:hypothetical protein
MGYTKPSSYQRHPSRSPYVYKRKHSSGTVTCIAHETSRRSAVETLRVVVKKLRSPLKPTRSDRDSNAVLYCIAGTNRIKARMTGSDKQSVHYNAVIARMKAIEAKCKHVDIEIKWASKPLPKALARRADWVIHNILARSRERQHCEPNTNSVLQRDHSHSHVEMFIESVEIALHVCSTVYEIFAGKLYETSVCAGGVGWSTDWVSYGRLTSLLSQSCRFGMLRDPREFGEFVYKGLRDEYWSRDRPVTGGAGGIGDMVRTCDIG